MTKMTRPVMKYLAEINFKNWDRIDEIIKQTVEFADITISELIGILKRVRDDIIFIDETFRDYLEED